METWITSDTHYGHKNIAGKAVSTWQTGYRGFDSVHDMNMSLVDNINKFVGEDDILYHLGDWSFGGIHNIYIFRKALVCKNIHLIRGNHDGHIVNKNVKFLDGSFVPTELFSSVRDVFRGKICGENFFLSHYSHQIWPYSHQGVLHTFGHSHGTLDGVGKSMDVGIDTHPEFRPYHIDEVISKLSVKEIHEIDHHEKL